MVRAVKKQLGNEGNHRITKDSNDIFGLSYVATVNGTWIGVVVCVDKVQLRTATVTLCHRMLLSLYSICGWQSKVRLVSFDTIQHCFMA